MVVGACRCVAWLVCLTVDTASQRGRANLCGAWRHVHRGGRTGSMALRCRAGMPFGAGLALMDMALIALQPQSGG